MAQLLKKNVSLFKPNASNNEFKSFIKIRKSLYQIYVNEFNVHNSKIHIKNRNILKNNIIFNTL